LKADISRRTIDARFSPRKFIDNVHIIGGIKGRRQEISGRIVAPIADGDILNGGGVGDGGFETEVVARRRKI
jgi:hypothetical protein